MGKSVSTAVFFSHSANNHSHPIDYPELYNYVLKFPGVELLWNSSDHPLESVYYKKQIQEKNIDRIVLAGFKPGFVKSFFAKVFKQIGKDSTNITIAEFGSSIPAGIPVIEYIKSKLTCALYDIPFDPSFVAETGRVIPETLVIGGGIAGIQAALEIANSHNKVFLLEKTGTIGGHMAMFDKTFPTLDCAACILTPKMGEAGQHPYIQLLTYSELKSVSGIPGNYTVKILQRARRVNVDTCTGCGTCSEKCPSSAASEFDANTSLRKAIYMPFPQAVPNKYLIDANACRYVQTGKCGVCVKVCPVEKCINLDEQDKIIEIQVGNIIVATGFKTFDAKRMEQYAYGKYPNVVTSLEMERLVNASGPTEGNIVLRSQDKKGNWIFSPDSPSPKRLAIIHCVGSRDENYNKYCSRVCCMYSLKLAHLIKEKLPDAELFEYYIDMRAFGKGYEEFYTRIKEEGVQLIRGKTARITEKDGHLVLRSEDIEKARLIEQHADMVVLSVGLEAQADSKALAELLGIEVSKEGWLRESDSLSSHTGTDSGGILIAGSCESPKDIPDSVIQASAAASRVLQSIMTGKIKQSLKNIPLEMIREKAKQVSPILEK